MSKGSEARFRVLNHDSSLTEEPVVRRPYMRGRVCVANGFCWLVVGAMAVALSDVAIVTDDNPRSEDPAAIRRDILAGAPDAREIGGRREAIAAAIAEAGPGDIVLIAGKGHEQGQIVGDRVLPFDDVSVARECAT